MEVLAIAKREKSRAPMEEMTQALVTTEQGVVGDFRGKPGKRQLTVLSAESWQDACNDVSANLPWTVRRSNILIKGIRFNKANVGDVIQIGEVRLEITRETDPCPRMDEQHDGLTQALMPDWRGGVCCCVVADGEVRVGDKAVLLAAGGVI
ncbi:MOSC domain-containing protein [Photobacterium sanguinicancri]|uniref:MOSC domain-containing protein n=1 Tax=Photobacterium sanguinicancri TaxID=875932 RepID=A0AAW7Y4X5_9GAMM|nr:MOSC domain-containing protein [Photobacterium sanguinicancri]MDO6541774.1 MOSC domain-containing protein [Photobacterium sanguinicancri]